MFRALLGVHVVVALCCLPKPAVLAQEHDPQLQERFLQGVKQTWEELQHASFRAKFMYSITNSTSDRADAREYEIGIRGRNGLQTGVASNGVPFVQARNDMYAFRLHRSPQGGGNTLVFVEPVGVDPSIDAGIADMEAQPRAAAFAAYCLFREPLARVIERDSFEIKRVYAVSSEDHEFVRIEFDYATDDPAQKIHDRFTDGYIVCDPARQWIVKEYGATFLNLNNNASGTRKMILEHADTIGEMPVATKMTGTSARHDKDYTSETVMNLEVIGRGLPEEELYLSYYGLPEPNFERSWLGTWGWYLIGGIGCIVVGAITIRWRNTRR